jgi:flavin-dependent dehydrogenase
VALRRVQFDAYMLEAARQRGIAVHTARVADLEFHADHVIVYTSSGTIQADVVVGAFGMDEGTAVIFERTVGYRPPAALCAIVTKYHPGEQGMQEFGTRVHAFLPRSPRIEFGAVTPKGNHLTINIAGSAVDVDLMQAFMQTPNVHNVLRCLENAGRFDANDLRYFKGRFPCGLAGNFAGDRYVMVGDAAGLVRAFKGKGITSAIQAGIRAAQVMLQHGISAGAFQAYRAINRDIIQDLPYGQAMRAFTILAARSGFMNVIVRAAGKNEGLRRALFDAVSAHRPYREVLGEALSLRSAQQVLAALLRP